jgi:5-formyltetrahydrofolate cyclo-ligase
MTPVGAAPPADDPALTAAKRAARADIRRRRSARSADRRRADDEARTRQLIERLADSPPRCVAAYLSAADEPSTLGILDWLASRAIPVLLPLSTGGSWSEPAWALYQSATALRAGPRSILEPTTDPLPASSIARADVVLCPGLAGTSAGERLGRGGGWYDRVLPLAAPAALVVLLLDDDEVLVELPTGPFDRRVDLIATPTRVIDCRRASQRAPARRSRHESRDQRT